MLGSFPLLSTIVWLPALGALVLYLLPSFSNPNDEEMPANKARFFSLIVTLFTFAISLLLVKGFVPDASMQFTEKANWIPAFGIQYSLGVDGISLWLVILTTFLMPLIILASNSVETKVRGYLANMLLLETAMLGTLVSLDVFLFYVFWELMLAPMYFIIGIWGGKRKIYATLKFVLYTVVGSLLMLVAIFFVIWSHYKQYGFFTYDLATLIHHTNLTLSEELLCFAAFAVAFGIKVPIFPFHTWLPDAHVEAPTGGSVVLAGVLLKMGLYGFIRFAYPLFPRAAEEFTPLLATLAVIGIIYGALVAWAQKDIKKLIAYSSVSHLGYCVLGFVAFTTTSVSGSIYQMLNHGISTPALFLLVGVLYDRKHTRLIADYGGLASKVPVFAFFFLVFTLSSIALPLTNGFVGEFLILLGSFEALPVHVCIAVVGVILGAVYMLTVYKACVFGKLDESKNGDLTDVNNRELATFIPLLILVFVMGIFPNLFLKPMEQSITSYIEMVESRRGLLESGKMTDQINVQVEAKKSV
jgi:NADH-quinone oxidoreductase subunit M